MKRLSQAQNKIVDLLIKHPSAYIIKSQYYNHNNLVLPEEVRKFPLQFKRPTFEFLERNQIIKLFENKKYILNPNYNPDCKDKC